MNFLKNLFSRHEDAPEDQTELLRISGNNPDTQKIGPLSEPPSKALIQILHDAAKRRSELQSIILANILIEHEGPQLAAGLGFVAGTEPIVMEHCIGALWESVTHASEELSSLVYIKLNNSEIRDLFKLHGVRVYGEETQ